MHKKLQAGFILPIVLVITSLVLFLIFALNWQNIGYLRKMQDLEINKQLEDAAKRHFALMLDNLNSPPLAQIQKSNYKSVFSNSGLYIDGSASKVVAGIAGVRRCKRKYNKSLENLVKLSQKFEGCAQVAIVFPNPAQDSFYYILSLHLYSENRDIEKYYQALAYNLTDSSFSSMPNWVGKNGKNLGSSSVEIVYMAECEFFRTKIYPNNNCR